jgi:hypothetical protein
MAREQAPVQPYFLIKKLYRPYLVEVANKKHCQVKLRRVT